MINDKLREIREQTGLNKKRFAEFIGIPYNNYEVGVREPNSDFIKMICR